MNHIIITKSCNDDVSVWIFINLLYLWIGDEGLAFLYHMCRPICSSMIVSTASGNTKMLRSKTQRPFSLVTSLSLFSASGAFPTWL